MSATEIQEHFNPGLGFANRRDIREYGAALKRRFRPGGVIRLVDVGGDAKLVTGTDNDFESLTLNADLFFLETEKGDELRVRAIYRREDLLEEFEIREGIVIPKEHYRFDRYNVKLDTSSPGLSPARQRLAATPHPLFLQRTLVSRKRAENRRTSRPHLALRGTTWHYVAQERPLHVRVHARSKDLWDRHVVPSSPAPARRPRTTSGSASYSGRQRTVKTSRIGR